MKKAIITAMLILSVAGLYACSGKENIVADDKEYTAMNLQLSVNDTYDFNVMGYRIISIDGGALAQEDNSVRALSQGSATVYAADGAGYYKCAVQVYADAQTLGGGYNLDKGMFAGKNVIVFGDSITDGVLLDQTKPNGLNYEDTYFSLLSEYLGAATDPTDLLNVNFACGGSTAAYESNPIYPIQGVKRVDYKTPFSDTGRSRNPYPNVQTADLCVIFYGTNDFAHNILSKAGTSGANDYPNKAVDAVTYKGALYYMISTLRGINPSLKILILPPLYRRATGNLSVTANYGIYNNDTHETMSDFVDVAEEISNEFGAKFINWYPLFNYENFGKPGVSTYSVDGLHPNVAGHKMMFDFIVDGLT